MRLAKEWEKRDKGRKKGVKTGQWGKGTKAMGFLQRRLLHQVYVGHLASSQRGYLHQACRSDNMLASTGEKLYLAASNADQREKGLRAYRASEPSL